jgi:hypothetical protein
MPPEKMKKGLAARERLEAGQNNGESETAYR